MSEIKELIGKTFNKVVNHENKELRFDSNHHKYKFYHEQDCCESVTIEDICGDLDDLTNTPIIEAEEVSSLGLGPRDEEWTESFTWTFYKFSSKKGTVTVRWYGESNGYYSESVYFTEVENF